MLDLATFTIVHTALSIIAWVSGGFVVAELIGFSMLSMWWLELFIVSGVLTSATGFFFPFHGMTPALILGVLALVLFAVLLAARYIGHLAKAWRWIYVVGVVANVYFLTFVAIVQVFLKVPTFHRLAPTGSEPAFAVTQGIALLIFVGLTILAIRRFRRNS